MLNYNSGLGDAGDLSDENNETVDELNVRSKGRPKGSRHLPGSGLPDAELVVVYKATAERYGRDSDQAATAFEPIYTRHWPWVYNLAVGRLGTLYAEDLAQETLQTVWERLNGKEVVTNLRGLVRHSFEREYVTLLEKLLQGRKLQRARQQEGQTEPTAEGGQPGKIKGAVVVSLNSAAPGLDGDNLELINLVEDHDASVPEAAIRLEQVKALHGLIDRMPSQYRGPLVCQWLMGMKIKAVAEELNLTIDQVKHNTARGISWLRKNMAGQPEDWLF